MGLEGRAAQSNSPVDCCDRERPSARRRANRVPPPAPEKSTSSEVLFSMKRTLRCMKNEAGLRPMKRGFAARRGTGASLHVCRRQTLHCWFCNYILLLRVKSQRRRVDFISLSAEQKISRPQSGYFTFCICKKFRLSFCTEQAYEAAFSTTQQLTDGLLLIYWVGGR